IIFANPYLVTFYSALCRLVKAQNSIQVRDLTSFALLIYGISSLIGPGFVSIAIVITAILFALPRRGEDHLTLVTTTATNGTTAAQAGISPIGHLVKRVDWNAYVILPVYFLSSLTVFATACTMAIRHHL